MAGFPANGDITEILIRYAWNHNIQLIRLDRDAAESEELPRYDWSSM